MEGRKRRKKEKKLILVETLIDTSSFMLSSARNIIISISGSRLSHIISFCCTCTTPSLCTYW